MKVDQFKRDEEKTTIKEKKTNMLLASFMLFIFPLILVVIGVVLGQHIGGFIGAPIQVSQIFGGIIAFVLAIALIKMFDKSAVVDTKEEKIYWDDL
ncbi:SoxR reducing system RseC family protein [Clostridium algoriphilum]|uniref:SoxR reducing system RseC family protein n=1 Tax=Clostridium algoriphilum TaxID=198347 RepID=UPI001CF4C11B|nr:SoxR reducing system RseC family protein [Clostridium algoriphilum]MCB2293880.1 SoxR reducing system RseC family protein [Clostridium algoriphilum]